MIINENLLTREEKATFALRSLYTKCGYSQYRMSKFEGYDLYLNNKSFLVSENVITFNDMDGSLMALKPDVTLSIIKSSKGEKIRKVFYDENVYRVPKGSLSFKEIRQAGLECMGDLDEYCFAEVLTLAVKSLEIISDDFVLDVSHMGIVSEIIDGMKLSDEGKKKVLNLIGEKNLHELSAVCNGEGVDEEKISSLKKLLSNGEEYKKYPLGKYVDRLISALPENLKGKVKVDFSVINDNNYYNGIVFKGFVNGIPTSVLSGGQYDNLMKRMGKSCGAVGFAVYLDKLEELSTEQKEFDGDVFLLYGNESLEEITLAVNKLTEKYDIASVGKEIPEGKKYKKVIKLFEGGEIDG